MIPEFIYQRKRGEKLVNLIFKKVSTYVYLCAIISRSCCILYWIDPFSFRAIFSTVEENLLGTFALSFTFFSTFLLALTLYFSMKEIKISSGQAVFKKTVIIFSIIGGIVFISEVIVDFLADLVDYNTFLYSIGVFLLIYNICIITFYLINVVNFIKISKKAEKSQINFNNQKRKFSRKLITLSWILTFLHIIWLGFFFSSAIYADVLSYPAVAIAITGSLYFVNTVIDLVQVWFIPESRLENYSKRSKNVFTKSKPINSHTI